MKFGMYEPLSELVVYDEPVQQQIAGRLLRTLKVRDVIETDGGAHALDIIQSGKNRST